MKSNLTEKLLSICGSADKTYGYNDIESITKLTEEQRIQIEAELIKHFEFDNIPLNLLKYQIPKIQLINIK